MGSFVQRIEPIYVVALQVEIEDGGVLPNPIGMDGLRDHDESMLKAPPNQDLRRRPIVPRSNFGDDPVRQAASPGEGAVCLKLDFPFAAELEQLLLIQERMELDLIHGRCDRCRRKHFLQMANLVVPHADRTNEAFFVEI